MAITQNYVDYNAGNDTTGDGSVGTPWKTLQKAFDTVTRETNDGNQINLKAGTAHVNSASLDLATFISGGALSGTAPLIIRGYSTAANDGGIGEIDCNGVVMWAATTYDFIVLRDLEIHNGGNNDMVTMDTYCVVVNCEFHKGASTPSGKNLLVFGGTNVGGAVLGCHFREAGTNGFCLKVTGGTMIYGNHFEITSGSYTGVNLNAGNPANVFIFKNVFRLANATGWGIYGASAGVWYAFENTFYNSAAGTGSAVTMFGSRNLQGVVNNIFQGWSGVNGEAIDIAANAGMLIEGYNAFYGNTANITAGDVVHIDLGNDDSLGASPFVNAGTGDFDINGTVAGVTEDAYPAAYLGLASTTPKAEKGAVQAGAPAADYPAVGDVQDGVTYGSGTYTGTFAVPAVGDVQDGVQYGASGTEYTGTFTAPAVGDVQDSVQYGAGGTEYTGTLTLPTEAQVESGVGFGAGGTEFTGSLVGGSDWTADEKEQIRQALGITGDTAATSGTGNLDTILTAVSDLSTDEEIGVAVVAAMDADPPAVNVTKQAGVAVAAADADGMIKVNAEKWTGLFLDEFAPPVTAYMDSGNAITSQRIRDAMKLAPTAGDPAAGSVDAKLDAVALEATAQAILEDTGTTLPAAIEAIEPGGGSYAGDGTGYYTDTIDDGTNPLDGVRVQLYTAPNRVGPAYEAYTNALGVFEMWPDPGVYYRWLDLAGYNFSQDVAVTVTEP